MNMYVGGSQNKKDIIVIVVALLLLFVYVAIIAAFPNLLCWKSYLVILFFCLSAAVPAFGLLVGSYNDDKEDGNDGDLCDVCYCCDETKNDLTDWIECGFKFCPWCGRELSLKNKEIKEVDASGNYREPQWIDEQRIVPIGRSGKQLPKTVPGDRPGHGRPAPNI